MRFNKKFAAISGAILCFLAVAMGAFGAHALSELLLQNQHNQTYELANRYHFYHGLSLLLIASLDSMRSETSNMPRRIAIACLFFGTIIFSTSLYVLALTKLGLLGAITPIGGLLLLIGWTSLAISFIRD